MISFYWLFKDICHFNPSKAAKSVNSAKSSLRFLSGKHTHCNNVYSEKYCTWLHFFEHHWHIGGFFTPAQSSALVTKDLKGNRRDHQVWSHFGGIKLGRCLGCTRGFWLGCARGLCLGCARNRFSGSHYYYYYYYYYCYCYCYWTKVFWACFRATPHPTPPHPLVLCTLKSVLLLTCTLASPPHPTLVGITESIF